MEAAVSFSGSRRKDCIQYHIATQETHGRRNCCIVVVKEELLMMHVMDGRWSMNWEWIPASFAQWISTVYCRVFSSEECAPDGQYPSSWYNIMMMMRRSSSSNLMRRTTFLLSFYSLFYTTNALTLTTQSSIRGVSIPELQNFLATPTNWPTIVASSVGVEEVAASSNKVNKPLKKGDQVREVFGLPPLIPLSVVWTCRQNDSQCLDFFAPEGLANVATNCCMNFEFTSQEQDDETTTVTLTIDYDPVSPLAIAAVPVLILDNEFALKVLLPNAIRSRW